MAASAPPLEELPVAVGQPVVMYPPSAQPMAAPGTAMAQPMMPGAQPMMMPGAQPVMMAQPMMPGAMTQVPRGWMPQTADQSGTAVGARVPPSFWARCCYAPCAISGYEHGDPTLGIFEGQALCALILDLLCCMGCVVSQFCWRPDPRNIRGDGTQRTVEQKCLAGFCVGFLAIAFWENGDFCCGPDGRCAWCTSEAVKGCMAHFLPQIVGLPSLDCCYVMCFWEPDGRFFRRSLDNHGGGAAVVGAPVQTAAGNPPFLQVAGSAPGGLELQGLAASRGW
ncbi:unnamed protein product [Prorocentrum cordatum]|uniref:Uncharacterized protein n=1 Tax=Prorocentrum cordatum TaxID=2364126 RepID=A0ABN9XHY2_9DINO|nr:unnamed protein product [Polarella glacialis]